MRGEQRKVHIVVWETSPRGAGPIGRAACGSRSTPATLVDTHVHCFVPRRAQCERCLAGNPSHMPHGQSASGRHILSSVLFCGALAGAWTPDMVRLLEQWLHDEDDAARDVLLDAAGQMGLGEPPIEGQPSPWGDQRREWLAVTGRHEHVWLPYRPAFPSSFKTFLGQPFRRCPCGVFEHEHILDAVERAKQGDAHAADITQRYLDGDPHVLD